ncbi:MAG: YidC/Oxa1 family membrane protein insertase [Acidimicrobiia bacterium]
MSNVWNALLNGMGSILALSYQVIPSAGLAIIILTVIVRLALFPLTAKQIRSMQRMQEIQPEIKKLQAKYKGDRQKLNEEMMKFYQENKVNPLAGCLPLLLQMPIFIALTVLLRNVQDHVPTSSSLYRDMCGHVSPSHCNHPQLDFLGMNLATKAQGHSGSNLIPYIILIGLVALTAYLQQKQSMSKQTTVNPQMRTMAYIMPLMMVWFSYVVPAGLALYFLVGNLWQMGQQEIIYRKMPPPGTASAAKPAPPPPAERRGFSKLLRPSAELPPAAPPEEPKPKPTPQQRRKKRRR